MNVAARTRRLPVEVTRAPLRTVRPIMLRGLYRNPEKELVRMRRGGLVTRIAPGTYVAKPDTTAYDEQWQPPFEEAAMAYATAAYGDRVPTLMGVGAARHWHAIPRAIGVTAIAVPAPHRPVTLATGGRVIFALRHPGTFQTIAEPCGLGTIMVTTIEQTLLDLIARPTLGGLPEEASAAAQALFPRADHARLHAALALLPTATARRVTSRLKALTGDDQ